MGLDVEEPGVTGNGLWSPTVSLEEAAKLLGFGRTAAFQAAREGRFPVPVVTLGRRYRVPTAPLLRLLGLDGEVVPNGGGRPP